MSERITQALVKLFKKHRIVFWYDEEESLRGDFESINLPEVEKVEIANNEFGLKYRLLREQPTRKFLVFKSGPQPEDRDNWLLDVQLAHIQQGVAAYVSSLYKIDQVYRKFIYHSVRAGQATFFGPLNQQVCKLYTNSFLLPLGDRWQELVDKPSVGLYWARGIRPTSTRAMWVVSSTRTTKSMSSYRMRCVSKLERNFVDLSGPKTSSRPRSST
jgi:hypothetical protein